MFNDILCKAEDRGFGIAPTLEESIADSIGQEDLKQERGARK